MKWVCNKDESNELCAIINEFDRHRSEYIKVNNIEFTKMMVGRRLHIGDPMLNVESKCVKINGDDIIFYNVTSSGTRYVYEGEILYDKLFSWYNNRLQKLREVKLLSLLGDK